MGVRSLVAAVALLVTVLAGCSTAQPEPGDTPAASVPAGLETGCPDPSTALRFPEGDLPAGATKVRLCPGPPQPHAPLVQAVPELLTRDVDDVVGAVNELEDLTGPVDCTFDGGPDLTYWFGYRDGDWRAVQLGAYGCRTLHVGVETERLGGIEVAAAFVDALTGQRARTAPPKVLPGPRAAAPSARPRRHPSPVGPSSWRRRCCAASRVPTATARRPRRPHC